MSESTPQYWAPSEASPRLLWRLPACWGSVQWKNRLDVKSQVELITHSYTHTHTGPNIISIHLHTKPSLLLKCMHTHKRTYACPSNTHSEVLWIQSPIDKSPPAVVKASHTHWKVTFIPLWGPLCRAVTLSLAAVADFFQTWPEMRVYKSEPTERNMFLYKRKAVTSNLNQGIFLLTYLVKSLLIPAPIVPSTADFLCVCVFCVCVYERERKMQWRFGSSPPQNVIFSCWALMHEVEEEITLACDSSQEHSQRRLRLSQRKF